MRSSLVVIVVLALLALPAAAQVTVTGITPATGPTVGGTTITITGTNLSWVVCFPICNPGRVVIGGVPVFVPFNSNPNALTIVTPPHAAGTVDVVVFPSDFGNGFAGYPLPNSFTYVDPAPALSTRALFLLAVALAFCGVSVVRRTY